MSTIEKITLELIQMRPEEQAEVLDFVAFLKRKASLREEREFMDFSLASAMRGMDDEPDIYGEEDIREPLQ